MNVNSVVISGNLTRDSEVFTTQSGTKVLRFGVAVNERRKGNNDEWLDYTNFVDCVKFGESADYYQQRLRKGTHVMVSGKLRYSSWEKDGERRSKLEVVAEVIDTRAQKQQGNGQQQPQQPHQQPTYSAPAPAAPQQQGIYDEDIPF